MPTNLNKSGFSCLLTDSALAKRKSELQREIFSRVKKVAEIEDGYLFHFDDDEKLISDLFYYIMAEKACCPFFRQEIAIGADQSGISWKISGENGVKDMLKEILEINEFPSQ